MDIPTGITKTITVLGKVIFSQTFQADAFVTSVEDLVSSPILRSSSELIVKGKDLSDLGIMSIKVCREAEKKNICTEYIL